MAKYRYLAQFTEMVEYEVEFESEVDLSDGKIDWFGVMDKAKPDWFSHSKLDVSERDLSSLTKDGEDVLDDREDCESEWPHAEA